MANNYNLEVGTYYDRDACDYDSRYWSNPIVQQMRQSFREEVKRYSAISMLEIGCGTGLDMVHFGLTHPEREIYGIDISKEMVRLSREKIDKAGCKNVFVEQSTVDDICKLFPEKQFDIIYIFFGALNTVENLNIATESIKQVLKPGGIIVLTFVNKWYIVGIAIELMRFRFSRAFARTKQIWGGYSPFHFLPSHCYTPGQVKSAFTPLQIMKCRGYSIIHPAWYFTGINKRLGKFRRVLWKIDLILTKTFLWRYGEYVLMVFQK